MGLAVIDVQKEGACRTQDAVRLAQPRRDEVDEIVEGVAELLRALPNRPIPMPAEAGAVSVHVVAHRLDLCVPARSAGVERRIDVDQRDGLIGDRSERLEVVGQHDAVGQRPAGLLGGHSGSVAADAAVPSPPRAGWSRRLTPLRPCT